MNEEKVKGQKIEWEKPDLTILKISLTEFNCVKLGDFNDAEDANCPRS
jgi:hypothetical protein